MSADVLLDRARTHVRKWFIRRMPESMVFHDLGHTLSVARTARSIGIEMGLPRKELLLLELAALFHDSGYALAYDGHEKKSAALAGAFLRRMGLPKADIQRVRAMILATRIEARPRTVLQRILRDADSAKAGQADFIEKSELLRKELSSVRGQRIGSKAWLQANLDYLRGHVFFTAFARDRFGKQKRINLKTLEERARTPKRERTPLPVVKHRYFDRDLSWLSFNDRVLQEAKDPSVPLLERIKFLAIYSSNLDEFYRVRVASLRSLTKLGKVAQAALEITPEELVEAINAKALAQQQEFGALYRNELLPALAKAGIRLLDDKQLSKLQRSHVRKYFKQRVAPLIHTASVRPGNAPFIEDRKLYFACKLRRRARVKDHIVLVNIPSDELGRFMVLPSEKGRTDIIYLDDVIRSNLGRLFTGNDLLECHAIKLSRDAELYLDEEFIGNVKEKVRKSLRKRSTGVPSRFLYDSGMPKDTLRALRELLALKKQDLVPGGRYHNFSDLMALPVTGHATLRDPIWPWVDHHESRNGSRTFSALQRSDILWHFPYHDFGNVLRWLQSAAHDPSVRHIAITLYRVANNSAVCTALMEALRRGIRVSVFVEVQARFDERSNLYWGEALEKAGARVMYSYEHIKVHCKLCLVERVENGRTKRYAYLGTGNFNERSSTIYSDLAVLTASPSITREVKEVFTHLMDRKHVPQLRHLLLAPTNLRGRLEALIDKEIEHRLSGKPASITLKLNSLEDTALIRKLYDASNAGVPVRLIIRGICCLVPGIKGSSERIEAISIVDRFLEHARVYAFHNAGRPVIYLSSADWMGRNLDRRVEVAFPILDSDLRQVVQDLLDIQWRDRYKARIIDAAQTNPYRSPKPRDPRTRSQEVTHRYFKRTEYAATKARPKRRSVVNRA